ncbi:MAG: EamA family transporter [candidate division WOR-3 bacterium]|nr:EamA family transporter [candidate division WOR-3 bacterium]
MDYRIYSLIALLFWGLWAYFSKVLTKSLITEHLAFFTSIGAWLAIAIYALIRTKIYFSLNSFWAILVGISASIATLAFYIALSKGPACVVVPLTGLYIVVPVILAYIFLSEPLTLNHIIGIITAIIAIFFLSR